MNKYVEKYIDRLLEKHGNKFDYSKVEYVKTTDKVIIICDVHGGYIQRWADHIQGNGCPICSNESKKLRQFKTTDTFIERSIKKFGDKFDYSKTKYVSHKDYLIITCKKHGDIQVKPVQHFRSKIGCSRCSYDNTNSNTEDFITKAKITHGDKFDYSMSDYSNSKVYVKIKCDVGHIFEQRPNDHLNGRGCNICASDLTMSEGEKELVGYISSIYNGRILENNRSVIFPREVDIYLPDLKIAIEYNGLYYHSEVSKDKDYHIGKTRLCSEKGIRLIHIWSDEWIKEEKKIKNFLRNIILQPKRLYARKLDLREVCKDLQREFIDNHHLQGYVPSSGAFGLFDDDFLIQIMTFKKLDQIGNYEIGRLCTADGIIVVGGANRLFKNLIEKFNPSSVISYNNLDKFTGKVYSDIGMKLEKDHIQSYFYTKQKDSFPRQQFQKHKLVKMGHDPSMTEVEIMNSMGYSRVFPAGNSKYRLDL